MKQLYFVMFLILQFVFSGSALAQEPTIDGVYTLVDKQKVNRVLYDFTYNPNPHLETRMLHKLLIPQQNQKQTTNLWGRLTFFDVTVKPNSCISPRVSKCGSGYKVNIVNEDATIQNVSATVSSSSAYTAISGLDFPDGDSTIGWMGWNVRSLLLLTGNAG